MNTSNTETENFHCNFETNSRLTKLQITILTVMVLLIGAIYLHFSWNKYKEIAYTEVVILAQSMESLLHPEHISELSGNDKDLSKPAYIMAQHSLKRLVETNNMIRFAYILGERNGSMIFLIDAESPDSPDYSPPGQIYKEAGDIDWLSFKSGKTVLTQPTTDSWGTWVSALVPIKDSSGRVIAVLGLDYSASEWNNRIWEHMFPEFIIVIILVLFFALLLRTWCQYSTLKILSKKMFFNEALYRSIFEQAPIGIAMADEHRYVSHTEYGFMNPNLMFEKITGWTSSELENINWKDIIHPRDMKDTIEKYEQFKDGKNIGYSTERRFIKPDGSTVWTNMTVSPMLGYYDVKKFHLCLLEDISTRKAAEESLKESERSKSVLLSNLPGMAYRCNYDREWTMQFISDGCMKLTGYSPERFLNNRALSFNEIISPEYRELLWIEGERTLVDRLPFKYEYEIITAEGKRKWVLELAEGIFSDKGEIEAIEGIIIDISERKEAENILRYNNEHDRWTGLFNRYYLENLLNGDTNERTTEKKALIGIDLSAARSITAAFGFRYTQELIIRTANVITKYCTDKRLLFYTYEDRFVFYLKDYKDKYELIEFAETLAETLESLLSAERIGGRLGIVEIDCDNSLEADELLKRLLIASEKAKKVCEKDFSACFYDIEMEKEITRDQDIKRELAQVVAGENNEVLFLQYQPIVDLKSNKIIGFEALARMKSERLGLVPPLEFIPISEKTKLIIPIGRIIFMQSFRFLNRLKEAGYTNISISVNVSAIQVLTNNFTADLLKMIYEMHVCPGNIIIEITESVFSSNYEDINNKLGELRNLGVKIAIDDFGTGYSSFAREQELNADCLKIDKYFIDKLMEISPDNVITAELISMAHKMGHWVIAEGVEHEKQKEYLFANGCGSYQGYLFARPLDEDTALEMIKKQ